MAPTMHTDDDGNICNRCCEKSMGVYMNDNADDTKRIAPPPLSTTTQSTE